MKSALPGLNKIVQFDSEQEGKFIDEFKMFKSMNPVKLMAISQFM